jgi:hypothetical protein
MGLSKTDRIYTLYRYKYFSGRLQDHEHHRVDKLHVHVDHFVSDRPQYSIASLRFPESVN